jgi:ferritin-like metal-binding protein YciE
MKDQSLRTLMTEEIRDLYDAEHQLARALPKLAENASSDELRTLIETHLGETEQQVKRLDQVFALLDEQPRGKHCDGIAGIIKEGSKLLEDGFDGAVLDAGIIAGAQRAEHYEIGAYGAVIAWAKRLGEDEVATLLHDSLVEEKSADEKLTALAESSINDEAAATAIDGDDRDREALDADETGESRNNATRKHPAANTVSRSTSASRRH